MSTRSHVRYAFPHVDVLRAYHWGELRARDPKQLAKILAQAKAPLKNAAAVNATRWALSRA